jgi:integrase
MRTNVKIDGLISDPLAEYRRERRKTITDVKLRWKKHLRPFFGRMKADNITDTVQRYAKKREEEGAKGPTTNRELAVLKHAFDLGLTWTPPKVRTVPAMKMYKESTPRNGFLTDDQYTQLARECNKEGLWLRALLTTAYTFAFRKGELLNLRVRQVDLASRVIQLDAGTTKNYKKR